jgi:hypothetical protein
VRAKFAGIFWLAFFMKPFDDEKFLAAVRDAMSQPKQDCVEGISPDHSR